MLNYRNALLTILLGSMLIIVLGWMLSWLSVWLVTLLLLINLGWIIAASFLVCSSVYIPVRCSGPNDKNYLALTFDDGPHPVFTPAVLDILKKHEIKAGFFVVGKNIAGNEDLLRRIDEEGHCIGSHSYVHTNNYGFLSAKKIIADLQKNEKAIEVVTGKKILMFRPPFGVTNPNIARAVRYLKYTAVGWNIRSLDTVIKDPGKVSARISGKLGAGSIILLHDSHERIVPILEKVILDAHEKGFNFVSPDRLLNIKTYR